MWLRDGSKKMSKSDASDQSRINLTDDRDTIALKIRRAKTDPEPLPEQSPGLEGRPEARNLVGIRRTRQRPENVLREHGGKGFGASRRCWRGAGRPSEPDPGEVRRLLDDPQLDAALRLGAQRAAAIAEPIVAEAERVVGFLRTRSRPKPGRLPTHSAA